MHVLQNVQPFIKCVTGCTTHVYALEAANACQRTLVYYTSSHRSEVLLQHLVYQAAALLTLNRLVRACTFTANHLCTYRREAHIFTTRVACMRRTRLQRTARRCMLTYSHNLHR
jgi:hypothetical protein